MRPEDGPLGLRRATAMFAVVAWAGAVLALVMGVVMLAGSTLPRSTAAVKDDVAAGEPLELGSRTSALLIWGSPSTADLSSVTCTGTSPSRERPLEVETERTVVTDVNGAREVVLVVTVETMPRVDQVVCSGGGLETVGMSRAGHTGVERVFGVFLLLLSPVLVGVGFAARAATRATRG